MENIKFIDITQLPEDLWQDAKNLIAVDSNGDVIKAAKQDSYTKDEIDELLKDAEISAEKLQNKIKINSASTDYVVTQPTVSGDDIIITDAISDKNQYHTFGYDKTITTTSNRLLDYSTPLFRGANEYNCPQWDGNTIRFTYQAGMKFKTRLTIPYTYNGVKYVTHFDIDVNSSSMYYMHFGVINDERFTDYQSVKFKESEVYKSFGANETFVFKNNNDIKDYAILDNSINSTYDFFYGNNIIEITVGNFPLTSSNGELIIETPRFYISENNVLRGDVPNESQSSDHPEHLNDYIRYANDVKAYILTDKNTTFKTINGEQITGNGNIEISTNVDLSGYYTKPETNALVNPKLSQVTLTQAEYDALSTKENNVLYVISDAEDIKFKTINGEQITGEGNITINTNVDLSGYYTKAEIDSMIGGVSSTITEINNLVV